MDKNLSDRLTIEEYKGMKYIYVDQTNLLPRSMIQLSKLHQELALKTGLPFITNFEGSFVTSLFLEQADNLINATKHLLRQGSTIGMNENKKWLLKAFNAKHNQNFNAHDSKKDALDFLFNMQK